MQQIWYGPLRYKTNSFYFKSHSVFWFIKYAFPVCKCSSDIWMWCGGGWWLWCVMMSSFNAFNLHDELPHVVSSSSSSCLYSLFYYYCYYCCCLCIHSSIISFFYRNTRPHSHVYVCMYCDPHLTHTQAINFIFIKTVQFHWIGI